MAVVVHKRALLCVAYLLPAASCLGFISQKKITHYTHRVWTQAEGLPQDTVRAIAQTSDGSLWVGTDEGLARFDGYRFVTFARQKGQLPGSGVTALCASRDGSLWIGTAGGLTSWRDGVFRTYGKAEGLSPDALVSDVREGPDGSVWVATGLHLARFRDGRFTNYAPAPDSGIQGIRVVLPDASGTVWVAGYGAVGRLQGDTLIREFTGTPLQQNIAMALTRDKTGHLLVSGTEGIFELSKNGNVRYTSRDGLPETLVRSLLVTRDGNLWVGTNAGLARRENGRFADLSRESLHPHEWVWCMFEDRDGNLWVGANSGLHQFLDQPFGVHTRADGLPSDQPTAVLQDESGRIWVGFHDSGIGYFDGDGFVSVPGLPAQEVFSVRSAKNGDLLIGTRTGLSRVHGRTVSTVFSAGDPLARRNVFDAIEDSKGQVWAGTNQGLLRVLSRTQWKQVVPGGTLLTEAVISILEARDGSIWAGTYGHGLWHVEDGGTRHYTTADGLPGEQIRGLYQDRKGALWTGTFNAGVARFENGRFVQIGTPQGLPSDNVARVLEDRQGSFWFATARGVAEIAAGDLQEFLSGRNKVVHPTIYGVGDGLRSAQCAPGYPTGTGGTMASDGRLWFPTGYGLAVFDPAARPVLRKSPPTRLLEVTVDGRPLDLRRPVEIPPDTRRLEFRYAAVELTAPESLRYHFRLDTVDGNWINAESRRVAEYSNLPYGNYRFSVAAHLGDPSTPYGEPAVMELTRLPHIWETRWFRWAAILMTAGLISGMYRWRLREVQRGFALVLDERSRIAREIHDTLAQGFVGISSQLEAVSMMLHDRPQAAAKHLEIARRMSKHSLTEARRSIVDLRAESLEDSDIGSAIRSAATFTTAGTDIRTEFDLDVSGCRVGHAAEQQLLRITQEAISNAVKHAAPSYIAVTLRYLAGKVHLTIHDDGRGFDTSEAFTTSGGHFGLLGMQERAERIHGELRLRSDPHSGTTIEVTVPA